MIKTKKQLEKEIKELKRDLEDERKHRAKNYELYTNKCDRAKLAGFYLQTLRVMLDEIGGVVQQTDFDRLTDILDVDHYPEGF